MTGGHDMTDYSKVCVLPFTHLATHPDGHTSFCCISDHKNCASHAKNSNIPISLNANSIKQMLNSETYKTARLEMLSGKEPASCSRCYDEERNGIRSKRQEENERYLKSSMPVIESTDASGSLTEFNFHFVELRLGNICNLKCRTCNPVSSSKWVNEHKKLQQELEFVTDYSNIETGIWFENDAFWQELLEDSEDLSRIYVNGGEPTLVSEHFNFLYDLIQSGRSSKIDLWYNINLTNVPAELLELWSKFKSISVTSSIDDLFERNEYIRTGSNWEETISNLELLKSIEWIDLSICQTLSSYNIYYVKEFYDYFSQYRIHHNWCYDPEFLSPWHLPSDVKEKIIQKCSTMPIYAKNNITQTLRKEQDINKFKQFVSYNRKLDLFRNTNFNQTFPELAKEIAYD